MNSYAPPLKGTADNLAQYGRYGDSMLVHMNPAEVQGIASLVPGGRLTTNPVTGQQEAFLPALIPLLAGWGGSALAGSSMLAGTALAGKAALLSGIGSGLATGIMEKDLGKGLAAGIMGYGLGKVFGAGAEAATPEVASTLGEVGVSASPESLARITEHPEMFAATPEAREVLAAAQLPTQGGLGPMAEAVMEPSAILPIGVGGAELARLEAEEELEDLYAKEDAEREGKLTRSEEEADRARRRSIYDYGLPTSGILPRDPRYAAGGGLISLNPRDYAAKRQGLSRLMGEPVRMQAGGRSPTSVSHSEMQSALRGPFKIAPSQMQQLYASGYRPGIDPELEYFRHEPFQGVMDPLDPNRAFVPSASQAAMAAAGSQIYDPAANIYGGEGPTGVPLGAGGSGFRYGDPMPRRGDYDEETGGIEHMKALRGWRAAQGYEQQPQRGTQELAKTMMLSLGQTPPDERSIVPRPGTGLIGTPPPVAPVLAPVTSYLPEASVQAAPVQSTYLSRRPRRSDYDAEGGGSEYRSDLREWLASQNGVSGYQGGGITELVGGAPEAAMPVGMPVDPAMAAPMDPAMMDQAMTDPTAGIDPATIQLVEQTAMAVLGQVPQEQADAIIQAFIQQFGPEAFQMLRQQVLDSVEPGAQTEGMVAGQGDGMSDEVMGMIGDQQRVAVSPGEYIVPADVVSGIGNGSSDAGAGELDRMMADIRQARTGRTQQPPAINPRGAMPV